VPFPNVNDTAEFNGRMSRLLLILNSIFLLGGLTVAGAVEFAGKRLPLPEPAPLYSHYAAIGLAGLSGLYFGTKILLRC
jgi:hypothetical protein